MRLFKSFIVFLFFALCARSEDDVIVEDDIVPYLEDDDDILTEFVDVSFDDVPFVEQADHFDDYHEFTDDDISNNNEWQPYLETKTKKKYLYKGNRKISTNSY